LVGLFSPNSPDMNDLRLRVDIIENPKFPDSQLPDRRLMLECGRYSDETFTTPRNGRRLMPQLLKNLVQDSLLIKRPKSHNFHCRQFVDNDLERHAGDSSCGST
jgi:hypothetical protein